MELPKHVEEYNTKSYWEDRFIKEEEYDWLCSYDKYSSILQNQLSFDDKILILGCGNSLMSQHLYESGYKSIVNIDYSENVIKMMKRKYLHLTEMEWLTMDIMDMQFAEETFDVILEKATLDAFMVAEKDPWNISDNIKSVLDHILSQVSKLLKPAGKFISITWSQPHFRNKILGRIKYGWGLDVYTFDAGFEYFVYVMKKGNTLPIIKPEPVEPDNLYVKYMEEETDEDFLLHVLESDDL